MSGMSMREQLEAAFPKEKDEEEEKDDAVGGDDTDTEDDVDGDEGEVPESDDGEGEDKKGSGEPDKNSEEEPPGDSDKSGDGKDADTGKKGAKKDDASSAASDAKGGRKLPEEGKAPESWKPAVREHWAKLPKEVKEEVLRREKEIQAGLHQASGYRKVANEYFSVVKPFEAMIRAQNSTPAQAVTNMLTTAARLTQGTKVSKAQVVAEIIKGYDIDIVALDTLLSGQKVDESDDKISKILDERLKPINDFIGTVRHSKEQSTAQTDEKIVKDLETFTSDAKNEFYQDVREDMADIMEMAANRGQEMTLVQAYDKACLLHPEISKILQQRSASKRGQLDAASVEKKKKAASSIKGSPDSSEKDKGAAGDLRGSIESAWDELEQQRA